ncbi:hypothetical protein BKA70DRAFT_373837 [Coprinopsis sp. MPI-PUGE-AT-0042]|nr:hypothetical protein BKA70DRAFT_373837 [Coprinopsis sp. MPI-PUGE-AT-0042]
MGSPSMRSIPGSLVVMHHQAHVSVEYTRTLWRARAHAPSLPQHLEPILQISTWDPSSECYACPPVSGTSYDSLFPLASPASVISLVKIVVIHGYTNRGAFNGSSRTTARMDEDKYSFALSRPPSSSSTQHASAPSASIFPTTYHKDCAIAVEIFASATTVYTRDNVRVVQLSTCLFSCLRNLHTFSTIVVDALSFADRRCRGLSYVFGWRCRRVASSVPT